jgi:hypothetical protein
MHANAGGKSEDERIIKENLENGERMHKTIIWQKGKMYFANSAARK